MRISSWLIAGAMIAAMPHIAYAADIKAHMIARYNSWAVYDYDLGDKTVCFAAARPHKVIPKDGNRRPVRAYVSTWPDIEPGNPTHVRELSFRVGRDVKSANVQIDGAPFTLFGKKEMVFVLEPGQEQKMISAMRRGKSLSVRAILSDGTATTDVYSLRGVTAALKALSKHCGSKPTKRRPPLKSTCFDAWSKIQDPKLVEAKSLMERGPDYAKEHYSKAQIAKIKDYFLLNETMKFRCASYTPPPGSNPKRYGPSAEPSSKPKRPTTSSSSAKPKPKP